MRASSQVRVARTPHQPTEPMKHLLIPPTSIDAAIATSAARHTNPVIQDFGRSMTWAADARVLGTLAAVGWIMSRGGDRRQRLVADHVAISLAAAVMLPKIMKRVFDRTRPDRVVVGPDRRGVKTSGQPHDSFPSGHSVQIGAIVSALSWAYPRKSCSIPGDWGRVGGNQSGRACALDDRCRAWTDLGRGYRTSGATRQWSATREYPRLRQAMTDKPFVLFPGMIEPLRAARIYGYLIQDGDALYHPGGTQPICTMSLARKMVEGGWLEQQGQRYEPTKQGLRAIDVN